MATQVTAWQTTDGQLFSNANAAAVHEVEMSKKKKIVNFYNSPAYPSQLNITQQQAINFLARWVQYDTQTPDPAP